MARSADDAYRALQIFKKALANFHEEMKYSNHLVRNAHDATQPFWHDSMRKEYDRRYDDVREQFRLYRTRVAEEYDEETRRKIKKLEDYLLGGRR